MAGSETAPKAPVCQMGAQPGLHELFAVSKAYRVPVPLAVSGLSAYSTPLAMAAAPWKTPAAGRGGRIVAGRDRVARPRRRARRLAALLRERVQLPVGGQDEHRPVVHR